MDHAPLDLAPHRLVVTVPVDRAAAVTEEQMYEVVLGRFATQWPAARPTIPFALKNEARNLGDRFALCTVTMTTSQQTTQGPRGTKRMQRNGWIQVKLWVPANTGTKEAAQLVKTVRDIFEERDLPSPVADQEALHTQEATALDAGEDGRWYMQLVRVPFWFVETT